RRRAHARLRNRRGCDGGGRVRARQEPVRRADPRELARRCARGRGRARHVRDAHAWSGAARLLRRGGRRRSMTPEHALRVMGIVGETETGELMGRVFASSGDELSIATDLAEGLARAASEPYDMAFVDISMGKNAG